MAKPKPKATPDDRLAALVCDLERVREAKADRMKGFNDKIKELEGRITSLATDIEKGQSGLPFDGEGEPE